MNVETNMTELDRLFDRVIKKAGKLSMMKMDELRSIAGYECENRQDAIATHKHRDRQWLLQYILVEEFTDDIDRMKAKYNIEK